MTNVSAATGSASSASAPTVDSLVERLLAHRMLGGAARSELEWLAKHSEFRHYEPGELLAEKGTTPQYMAVMLTGLGAMYIDRGPVRRKMTEWGAGDVTGVFPFSRLQTTIGDPVVEEAADVLLVDRAHFPEMIREMSKLTPQGHVHAQELYSAVNIVKRVPPGPLFALLSSKPEFTHVGDLHFRLSDSE